MELTTVKELFSDREKYLDKEVQVGGWIRSIRDSKAFGFIVLNDGTCFDTLQIVYHDTMENFAEVSKLNVGAAIIVKGTLVATPEAKRPLRSRRIRCWWRAFPMPTIHCRKNVTALSIYGPFPICAPGPIRSRRCSVLRP